VARTDHDVNASFDTIGAFWPYGKPDQKFTGSLSCDKGRLLLKSAPVYSAGDLGDSASDFFLSLNSTEDQPRVESVIGYTSEGGCTLLSLLPLNDGGILDFSTGQRIKTKQYRIAAAVMGMELESFYSNQIHSCIYHFTKIHRWFPTALSIRWEEGTQSFVVPTKESEVFRLKCAALSAEVLCDVRAHGGVRAGRSAEITSSARITVTPDAPQSASWFYEIGNRLENLLTLCLGTSVSLRRMRFAEGEKKGFLITRQRRKSEKVNSQLWIRCPSPMLALAIDRWLSVPIEKRHVERTLLGMLRKSSVFDVTEFLSMAQALEGFDRIHGKPGYRTFAKRIEQTYEMLSTEFAQKLVGIKNEFVRRVVDTRNLYTHLGTSAGNFALEDDGELFDLNQRLNAFLRCIMLINLGINESDLRDPILYQSSRWKLQ